MTEAAITVFVLAGTALLVVLVVSVCIRWRREDRPRWKAFTWGSVMVATIVLVVFVLYAFFRTPCRDTLGLCS